MRVGGVIVMLNGEPITDASRLDAAVERAAGGSLRVDVARLAVVVMRAGAAVTLPAVV